MAEISATQWQELTPLLDELLEAQAMKCERKGWRRSGARMKR